jgi:Na+/H+-dicarboxylate symporter
MSFTKRILLAMFLGISFGSLTNNFQNFFFAELIFEYLVLGLFDVLGQIFINLLKLLVVPLVFVSLVCGVGQVSSGSQLGSIGIKSALLYLLTTSFAIFSALLIASFFSPGAGINIETVNTFFCSRGAFFKRNPNKYFSYEPS